MKIAVLALLLIPTLSFAGPKKIPLKLKTDVPAMCTAGSLPSVYSGKYIVLEDGKTFNIDLAQDKATVTMGQDSIVVNVKSCVVQGIRLVTLTVGNDPSYVNFIVFVSLDSKKVFLTLLNDTPQSASPNTLPEIISRMHTGVISYVLQGVTK